MSAEDPCWVCNSTAIVDHAPGGDVDDLTPDDLRISDKRYGLTLPLQRCENCGFVFATKASLPALTPLYAELDDAEYGASAVGRRRQMRRLIETSLHRHPGAKRLLDVGAASGILVSEAKALGLDATGIEPSGPLAARARAEGLDVHTGIIPSDDLDEAGYDIVTLIDVVEHVDDPVDLLRQCRRYLAPDGALVVVTPDQRSIAARVLGKRWWHRRLAHVGYFDRSTLTAALEAAALTPTRWSRPRWYFPVKYLFVRVLQYVPGLGSRVTDRSDDVDARPGLIIPLNLFDSLTVIAERRDA